MDSSRKSSSNKIRDIVRLQQIIKKWKKFVAATTTNKNNMAASNSSKCINKFLKKTLSFSEKESSSSSVVPKGYVAVCVGEELKRYVIPTEYLGHQVFRVLLREAEEEFGFQQEGVLRFPCHVDLFDKVLKLMEQNNNNNNVKDHQCHHEIGEEEKEEEERLRFHVDYSDTSASHHHHPQMCR